VHGVSFEVTGSDGGRWPRGQWRNETTELVAVGQTRDIEFVAPPGDWAFHCHMAHHTMNPMGHGIANPLGVDQTSIEEEIRSILPDYMAMGEHGMADHQEHTDSSHMPGPENTLPMFMGQGPFGRIGMGGMFTLIKVRDDLEPGDFRDAGWYRHPDGEVAWRISDDPDFGNPVRRGKRARKDADELPTPSREANGHRGHGGHGGHNR
jgi:manganese oxidase